MAHPLPQAGAGATPEQIATWAGHTPESVVLDRYGRLNGRPVIASDPRPLLGPRRMEAKSRVQASSDPVKGQGEDRSLSGSLRRLGPSTDLCSVPTRGAGRIRWG
jgi:hypothetical protein